MRPTVQQQAVIDSDQKDILVEAGAGSGKTTTTVARYVRLIEEKGYEPREILAFTFTDKAAGELRDKVRKARRELAVKRGESNPQSFSMSDAWVGTFHAICNRILKAYPVEAGVDPGFGVIDDVTSETVRSEAFSLALAAFRKEDVSEGDREKLIGLFTEKSLREAVTGAYDELRSRGVIEPQLPDFKDTPYPAQTIASLASLASETVAMGGLRGQQESKTLGLIELLSNCEGSPVSASQISDFTMDSTNEDLKEFISTIDLTISELVAHEGGDQARRGIARLLELFSERYTQLKARRSVLDYEDLQLLTLELLNGKTMIRDWYRERFKEIMVDEFQDTNQLQLDLVLALRGENTTLMTVGDEMQSIYGFRHADVELFRARRNDLNVKRLLLTDNFRSLPEVIGAVNEIGQRLDKQVSDKRGADASAGRHVFADLTIGRPGDGDTSSARVILTGPKDWKGLELGDLAPRIPEEADVGKAEDHHYEAEALGVAHELRKMVDEGLAKQSEIVILLRAKTRTDVYVKALLQVGLSPYLVAGAGFWKTREAVEMRALLGTIANPLDDESLISTLTSPACGLSSNALWLLRKGGPDYKPLWPTLEAVALGIPVDTESSSLLESIPEEDLSRIVEFQRVVSELRTSAVTMPLDGLVEKAVTTTGYDLATLIRDPSRNGMSNIRRLGSLALEFELAEGRNLRGFLDWIALSASLDSEASSATQEEDSEVVRIMTIHAAKGLEFKVACVPDCGRSVTNRHNSRLIFGRSVNPGDPLDFQVGLNMPIIDGDAVGIHGWKDLNEAAKLSNEDEELRLFHVAMTRAEDHLVIGGVIPKRNQEQVTDAASMINRVTQAFGLEPTDPENWPDVVPDEPEPDAVIEVIKNLPTENQAAYLRAGADLLEASTPPISGVAPLSRPKFEVFPNVPLSFTALNAFTECPTRFYAQRVLRITEPEDSDEAAGADPAQESLIGRDRATAFGSAVHDVLETLGNRKWPTVTSELITRSLERRGADPTEDFDRASDMVTAFVESDIGERVISGKASFEEPLLVRIERITVRGFADLILEDNPPMVLDYKTNFLGDKTPVDKMPDYALQRDLYALALARSRGLNEVESAYVFLEKADQPVIELLDTERLEEAEERLGRALREITSGHFFGGPTAKYPPCNDCWACKTLRVQRERALIA